MCIASGRNSLHLLWIYFAYQKLASCYPSQSLATVVESHFCGNTSRALLHDWCMLHFHHKLYVLQTWKWSFCGIIQHIPIIANFHNHQYISRHIPWPLKFTSFCMANSTHCSVLGPFYSLLTTALLWSTMGIFRPSSKTILSVFNWCRQTISCCNIPASRSSPYGKGNNPYPPLRIQTDHADPKLL